jgi:F420-dependent oxidoreductase-like protein
MKLGIAIDWSAARIDIPLQRIKLAEELGFDSIWSAEAYGSDSLTPLAFIAAHTKRIRLGTCLTQISARTPVATAMAAATIDQLAGDNRMVLGLGLSGPQVVEGWYGQRWDQPYSRMKDYVAILRKYFKREAPITHEGKAIQLPYRGERSSDDSGAERYGKPLKSILHPNRNLPIFLGTGGEQMVTLTAEIADGWLPFGFVPGSMKTYRPWLAEGFQRANANPENAAMERKGFHNFFIQAATHVRITDDVKSALDSLKFTTALYVGGMGHERKNFHKDMMARRGFPDAAEKIQRLFLEGRRSEAVDAVPDEYVDEGALIGPPARIRERLDQWMNAEVQGLTLYQADEDSMRLIAGYVAGKI